MNRSATQTPYWERPCAAKGLLSYRWKGPYGFIMIGATDDVDALREARRSNPNATESGLEYWNGTHYVSLGDNPS